MTISNTALAHIYQIVEAEPFILSSVIVEQLLDLLAIAVGGSGHEKVVVTVPDLGTLEAIGFEGRMMFRLRD